MEAPSFTDCDERPNPLLLLLPGPLLASRETSKVTVFLL